jgi:hypothetical protein
MKTTRSIGLRFLLGCTLLVVASGCRGRNLPKGVQVSVGRGGITVYRPDQGRLYAYTIGQNDQVTRCESWAFTGPNGAPVPEPCK